MAQHEAGTPVTVTTTTWETVYEFENPGCSCMAAIVVENAGDHPLTNFRFRVLPPTLADLVANYEEYAGVSDTDALAWAGTLAKDTVAHAIIPVPVGTLKLQATVSAGHNATITVNRFSFPKESVFATMLDGKIPTSSASAVALTALIESLLDSGGVFGKIAGWDQENRARVSPIEGADGGAAGGIGPADDSKVTRVVLATDGPGHEELDRLVRLTETLNYLLSPPDDCPEGAQRLAITSAVPFRIDPVPGQKNMIIENPNATAIGVSVGKAPMNAAAPDFHVLAVASGADAGDGGKWITNSLATHWVFDHTSAGGLFVIVTKETKKIHP